MTGCVGGLINPTGGGSEDALHAGLALFGLRRLPNPLTQTAASYQEKLSSGLDA